MSHAAMKLGRKKASPHRHRLMLRKFMTQPLPPAPTYWDGSAGCTFPMFANDRIGDCTIAGIAHWLHMQAEREGRILQFTDAQVERFYFAMTGGADTGLNESDVLAKAKEGFPLPGVNTITAYAAIDPRDVELWKSAMVVFRGCYNGLDLPLSAQDGAWITPSSLSGDNLPGSWGGHCTVNCWYSESQTGLVTWGGVKVAELGWFADYCEEIWVALDSARAAEHGVNFTALLGEMAAVAALSP